MRLRGPKEKKERSLGEHLHLKGDRCNSPKCAAIRKPYPPGMHGQNKRRKAMSDFGKQLFEKQKFKVTYGVDERGIKKLFEAARKGEGETSSRLLGLLESRLDNIIYRLGFAKSRYMARQMVVHGHFTVNGRKVKSPGYQVKMNDIISIRKESRANANFNGLKEYWKSYELPSWLALDYDKEEGRVISLPDTSKVPFEISLLVESFSK